MNLKVVFVVGCSISALFSLSAVAERLQSDQLAVSNRMGENTRMDAPARMRERQATDPYVGPFHAKLGLGNYGVLGVSGLARPTDWIGIDFGIGVWLGIVQEERFGSTDTNVYAAPVFGVGPNFYFTSKDQQNQHSINLRFMGSPAYGGAVAVGYGYERHSRGGVGLDFGIGLAFAPNAESELESYIGRDIDDFTWIPIYLTIGIIF